MKKYWRGNKLGLKKKYKIIIWLTLTAIVLTAGYLFLSRYIKKQMYPLKYEEYVAKYAAEFDVPQEIVFAVIYAESSYRENAVSKVGAIGLMQIMPDTYTWLAKMKGETYEEGALSNPETNIKYGVYYLSYLYKRFGNWDTALAGYNAGHGRVSGWLADTRYSDDGITLKSIPYPETEQFVKKVNKVKLIYVDLYCENSQFVN